MKIADRTPFRNASGIIDVMGRVQGTLKYGLNWYDRLQAQDVVIAVLDKVLGADFILLRNVTLPDTEIDLPLVLIGPPGVYLINVIHERGVYRAKDDEWGTVSGEKLVPAAINQLQRTVKLGRVLQIYLERAGLKDVAMVDPILMAASPGMHIESVRPAARIVMSDALERFAISMNQARSLLTSGLISTIAHTVVNGPKQNKDEKVAVATATVMAAPISSGRDTSDTLFNPAPLQDSAFSAESLGFSFDDTPQVEQSQLVQQPADPQKQDTLASGMDRLSYSSEDKDLRNTVFLDDPDPSSFSDPYETRDASATVQLTGTAIPNPSINKPATSTNPGTAQGKKKIMLGMTATQLIVLGVILLFWLCSMVLFAGYVFFLS